MPTVARNTKEFKKAVSEAKQVKSFNLGNFFGGDEIAELPAHAVEDGKLTKNETSYYLRLHSNQWYEWSAA